MSKEPKQVSKCHRAAIIYRYISNEPTELLCELCGQPCLPIPVVEDIAAKEEVCGVLIHASDGSTCANKKGECVLHDKPARKNAWGELRNTMLNMIIDDAKASSSPLYANSHPPEPREECGYLFNDGVCTETNPHLHPTPEAERRGLGEGV